MSEILSNIVVEQTNINFSPDNNNLNITPEAIQLNIFTGASPGAGQSSNGQLLYNNTNLIDGVPNTSVSGGNLTFNNLANLKIAGGTNGYVLQTDGTGNLDWTAMTGGGGNGSPGGSNTQIQYNDNGLFGGASGFTFNEVSGNVAIPGALAVTGVITGVLSTAAQPNITSVGTLTSLGVSGNITAANITANTGVFTGNATGLNNIPGANVTGTVANATFATTAGSATTAGTVTTNAQPNITSVGTLTGLGVSGNITAANITANTGVFTGNASGLTNIPGANVTGQVGNALVAGTVYTNAQPNITSVGTLTSLSITGNATAGNVYANSGTIGALLLTGTLTTNAQPNITSVGTLTTLTVSGNVNVGNITANRVSCNLLSVQSSNITLGTNSGIANQQSQSIAIGYFAGNLNQGVPTIPGLTAGNSIAIGTTAGSLRQGGQSVALGYQSCEDDQEDFAIAIGSEAGRGFPSNPQGRDGIAIGTGAARQNQGLRAVALGFSAGDLRQGEHSIAIGTDAASSDQGTHSIAIGRDTGDNQGTYSIALGSYAGPNNQANNSIAINATGSNLNALTANAFFVKPIRNATSGNVLYYNSTSGEITFDNATYGCFHKIANVTAAAANTVYNFDWYTDTTVHVSQGITVTSGQPTRVNIDTAGNYAVFVEMQAKNTDNQDRTAWVWLSKNGTPISETTVKVTLLKQWAQVIAKQWVLDNIAANDYIEVNFAVDNTSGISLEYNAAQTTPFIMPAQPSATLTITPIGA